MSESPENVKRRLEMRGFSRDQVSEMQKLAASMAQQQMRNTVGAASNFLSTVVALLSSAVGFVAAFAWNDAIKAWLDANQNILAGNPVGQKFVYAMLATLFAVIVIAVLGFINGRIKGRNLLGNNTPTGM